MYLLWHMSGTLDSLEIEIKITPHSLLMSVRIYASGIKILPRHIVLLLWPAGGISGFVRD